MFASYVSRNAFPAWHDPSYDVIDQMLEGSGQGGPSLHWAIGQEIATKCYQIDVSGVAILNV